MYFINDEDSGSEDEDDLDGWGDETDTWGSLDTILVRLAKQVDGKLTLRLNVRRVGSESVKFDRLLNQFLQYGELDIHSTQIHIRCRKVNLHLLFLFASNLST